MAYLVRKKWRLGRFLAVSVKGEFSKAQAQAAFQCILNEMFPGAARLQASPVSF